MGYFGVKISWKVSERGFLVRMKSGDGLLAQLVRIQIIVKGDKRYLRNLMMIFILIQQSPNTWLLPNHRSFCLKKSGPLMFSIDMRSSFSHCSRKISPNFISTLEFLQHSLLSDRTEKQNWNHFPIVVSVIKKWRRA
jgi:hypothetical protein